MHTKMKRGLGLLALMGAPLLAADDDTAQYEPKDERNKTAQLSELMGTQVKSSRTGDTVELEDAVVDLESGKIAYLVYSMDGKNYAANVDELQCNRREDGDLNWELHSSPVTSTGIGESSEHWPSTYDASGDGFVHSFDDESDREHALKRSSHVMRASKLLGCDVVNAAGDDLGEISEIVLTLQPNQEPYGVLSSGGFLGMGEDAYAIPLTSIRAGNEKGQLVMNAQPDDFERARSLDEPFPLDPRFAVADESQLQSLGYGRGQNRNGNAFGRNDRRKDGGMSGWNDDEDSGWGDDDDSGWGDDDDSGWGDKEAKAKDEGDRTTGRSGRSGRTARGEDGASNDGAIASRIYVWRVFDEPRSSDESIARGFEQGESKRLQGEVVSMSTGSPSKRERNKQSNGYQRADSQAENRDRDDESDMWITVESDTGTYDVLVAPRKVLDKQDFKLSKGDEVTIEGVKMAWGGDMIVVSDNIRSNGKWIDLRDDDGTTSWSSTRSPIKSGD